MIFGPTFSIYLDEYNKIWHNLSSPRCYTRLWVKNQGKEKNRKKRGARIYKLTRLPFSFFSLLLFIRHRLPSFLIYYYLPLVLLNNYYLFPFSQISIGCVRNRNNIHLVCRKGIGPRRRVIEDASEEG